MTEPIDVPPSKPPEGTPAAAPNEVQRARAERATRLAKALRDNLRRRKAVQPKPVKAEN
ncbi:hypothetical protein [Brevundimonas sp. NIBR11]|uniref:hypothetical protein n=1 Tax=Brevundimonas sp. NIBR11 TaxID=3015999 RepID=UPI0022F13B84|nr:hypothetical protein [Brevundimonas sp. NIBR11]WGM30643.1 hypothetical protein KKHFBJBL_00871 [Brevundimonas sp. NIBR11]